MVFCSYMGSQTVCSFMTQVLLEAKTLRKVDGLVDLGFEFEDFVDILLIMMTDLEEILR